MKILTIILILMVTTSSFSQEINPIPDSSWWGDMRPDYYEPLYDEKIDKKSGIKIVYDLRFLKDKRGKYIKDQVMSFRKNKNPWLSKDFRVVIGCVGSCTTTIAAQKSISKNGYLYYQAYFWSPKTNGYVFIFKKNQEGFYELTGLQEFYYAHGDYTRNFETYIQYVDTPIQWYKGKW